MESGRALDALVAEKVMGVVIPSWLEVPAGLNTLTSRAIVRPYSTDIAAAWQVVERLVGLGYPTITVSFSVGHQGYIACVWRNETDPEYLGGHYLASVAEVGLSAPHAICLVALKVLDVSA